MWSGGRVALSGSELVKWKCSGSYCSNKVSFSFHCAHWVIDLQIRSLDRQGSWCKSSRRDFVISKCAFLAIMLKLQWGQGQHIDQAGHFPVSQLHWCKDILSQRCSVRVSVPLIVVSPSISSRVLDTTPAGKSWPQRRLRHPRIHWRSRHEATKSRLKMGRCLLWCEDSRQHRRRWLYFSNHQVDRYLMSSSLIVDNIFIVSETVTRIPGSIPCSAW